MIRRRDMRAPVIVGTVLALGLVGYSVDRIDSTSVTESSTVLNEDNESRLVHQGFQQSVAMLHAGQYEHAVQALHEVLALRPTMPEAHANMGYALLGLGRHSAARDFFESATTLRPSQLNAYYGMALSYEALGDRRAAMAAMQTYVHLVPADDPYRVRAEAAIWEWQSAQPEGQR